MTRPLRLLAQAPVAVLGAALAFALAAGILSGSAERAPPAEEAEPGTEAVEAPPARPKPELEDDAPGAPGEESGPVEAERVLPTAAQVFEARRFADGRRGLVSFAVVDTEGRMLCHRCARRQSAGSVVKAMLLVAYLERVAGEGRPLTARERRLLSSMITVSDNPASDETYRRLGDAPLLRLAERAGMERFSVRGSWSLAVTTAADQARFFARLDHVAPDAHRAYARELLSSIVPEQSWGLAAAARPEWRPLFKGGWTPTRRGHLAHQAGRLEREGQAMAVAILTDGNPSHAYGRETVRGIAAALLDSET